MTAVAGSDQGLVAIGTQQRPEEDLEYWAPTTKGPLVWVSTHGFEWHLLDAYLTPLTAEEETSRYAYLKRDAPVLLEDVARAGDRMWAIGGYELAPSTTAIPSFVTLWTSSDGGVTWQIAAEETLPPSDCACGANSFTGFGDSTVLVGVDAISVGKHPNGWEVWATTPAVWIAALPGR